jgi:TRAP-type C4-dicarboxylate transport system substrate-binding protein
MKHFVVMVIGLVFLFCNSGIAAEKKKASVIELKYAGFLSEQTWIPQNAIIPWQREVEAATNGRVKIVHYGSQTLCKGPDAWEATKTGIADIAWLVPGYTPGMFPVSDVLSLPLLPIPNSKTAAGIHWRLYEKFPEIADQFKEVKLLMFFNCGPRQIYSTKKAGVIKRLADFRGLKLRALGGPTAKFLAEAGSAAVAVGTGDIYSALERGIIDGLIMDSNGLTTYSIGDVVEYINVYPLIYPPMGIIMNLNKWNSLTPDIQEAIMSVSGLIGSEKLGKRAYDDHLSGPFADDVKKYGITTYTLNTEEIKEWENAALKQWESWIDQMKSRGIDGQKILDEVLGLSKTYK